VERCAPRTLPKMPVRRVEGPACPAAAGARSGGDAATATPENRALRLCRLGRPPLLLDPDSRREFSMLDADIRRA
jgi:hypothetical protein